MKDFLFVLSIIQLIACVLNLISWMLSGCKDANAIGAATFFLVMYQYQKKEWENEEI